MKKLRKIFFLLLFPAILSVALLFFAPRFLLYSSKYEKADTIVLFLGPDFTARQKETYKLINEGLAGYLIIPAYNKVYKIKEDGSIRHLLPDLAKTSQGKNNEQAMKYPRYFEDTHGEILEAKRVMAVYGLESAIFVSSPYHMRRINYMAKKVFSGSNNALYFVPTRFEKAPANFWELSWTEWRKVGREYGKIIWFFLYA